MRSTRFRAPALLRRYERELVCPRCRGVVAWARLAPLSPLRLSTRSGERLAPTGAALLEAILSTRLADARDGADAREVARLERELRCVRDPDAREFYELTCPDCGARYLRSTPVLAGRVRGAAHGRVPLG